MRTNSVPDNVLEWGETGTGKTLVARHVCERLEAATEGTDSPIVTAYINPDPISTYTSTFRKIAEQVNAKAENPRLMSPIRASQPNIIATRNCGPLFRGSFQAVSSSSSMKSTSTEKSTKYSTRFHGRNQKTTLISQSLQSEFRTTSSSKEKSSHGSNRLSSQNTERSHHTKKTNSLQSSKIVGMHFDGVSSIDEPATTAELAAEEHGSNDAQSVTFQNAGTLTKTARTS